MWGMPGKQKPHLEHNPLSLLGVRHAIPMRKLNDPVQGLELLLELIEVVVQPQEMRMDGWWCMLPLLMGKRESPATRVRVGLT
jgi:hypothetical protein